MNTLQPLLFLPTHIQTRIISFLPRHMHHVVLKASPCLRRAVQNQKRSVLHALDLAPSQAELPQPSEPAAPWNFLNYYKLIRLAAHDLRILHLTSGVDYLNTVRVLNLAICNCKNLESLAFNEGGMIAAPYIAGIIPVFSFLKSLRLINVGTIAMKTILHTLAESPPAAASLWSRNKFNLIFSGFSPSMLQDLLRVLKSASTMVTSTHGSETDYKNEPLNGLLNLTVSLVSTESSHSDQINLSKFTNQLQVVDSSSMVCLNSLELQIPRLISSMVLKEQCSDLLSPVPSVEWKFVPRHMSFVIRVINSVRLEIPRTAANDVPGTRRAAYKMLTQFYEPLLHSHITQVPLRTLELFNASEMSIFDHSRKWRGQFWSSPVQAAHVHSLHGILHQYSRNITSIYLQCIVRHENILFSFHRLSRKAEVGVKWTQKLLSDFPSVRRLSCPRRLILSLEICDVTAMFLACRNIEILHLLNDQGERVPRAGGLQRYQCKTLTGFITFLRFLQNNFPKLSCVYMETAHYRMNNNNRDVLYLLKEANNVIDIVEVERPELDIITMRHQLEDWIHGNAE